MALTFSALEHDLRRRVDGEVRFDAGSRGAYSTDASNYRQVPVGVVVPRTVEAGAETVAVCARHGVPVVSRPRHREAPRRRHGRRCRAGPPRRQSR